MPRIHHVPRIDMEVPQQVVGDRWIIGWASICAFTGFRSKTTIQGMARESGFPLYTLPGGKPATILSEVNNWLRSFSEVSSPFRLQKLSGAGLRSSRGELVGIVARNPKRTARLSAGLTYDGKPVVPPQDGPISPFQTFS